MRDRTPTNEAPSTDLTRPEKAAVRVFGIVLRPVQAFLQLEAASGLLLLGTAVAALLWANLSRGTYDAVVSYPLAVGAGGHSARFTVLELVNDGLMTVFFLLVGMEIKRELVIGELRSVGRAALPAVAAVGGMILPASIYFALNRGGPGTGGWAIPMATDIAFCVGVLTLLKGRIPHALVVFVTALAIFDDIGGILVIAAFYGHGLHAASLAVVVALCLMLAFVNRLGVGNGLVYAALCAALWLGLHDAGVHATLAGVVIGMAIPARAPRDGRNVMAALADHARELAAKPSDEALDGAEILSIEETLEDLSSPLNRFVHALHPFVAFGVMPLFALTNAGLSLGALTTSDLVAPVALGTFAGLLFGKTIGIFSLTLLAVRLGLAPMPGGATRVQLLGASVTAGIGFTVAIFIANLAFADPLLLGQAKLGILVGSLAAGVMGFAVLRLARGTPVPS
jgi:Na+:H+ antiporter, NhaA family